MTSTLDYDSPVDRLLSIPTYKGGYKHRSWPDYVGAYGLTADHVPELIRLANDIDRIWALPDKDDPIGFAPLHAVRALGQLGDPRAIAPLLTLMVYNSDSYGGGDFMSEIIPQAVGLMGAPAIEPLRAFLADEANGLWPRIFMDTALEVIAEQQPELRPACVDVLAGLLANYEHIDTDLTTSLVSSLVDLRALEHIDLIEAAFTGGYVDRFVRGDWEDVQVELGLLAERVTPRKPAFPSLPALSQSSSFAPAAGRKATDASARDERRRQQAASKKRKAKRKKQQRRR
jgi:hypothetical protein